MSSGVCPDLRVAIRSGKNGRFVELEELEVPNRDMGIGENQEEISAPPFLKQTKWCQRSAGRT
jgi:hypothetical protein